MTQFALNMMFIWPLQMTVATFQTLVTALVSVSQQMTPTAVWPGDGAARRGNSTEAELWQNTRGPETWADRSSDPPMGAYTSRYHA
jgi:hypothetical protein